MAKDRDLLIELLTPGQPAFQMRDIQLLKNSGLLRRFAQLADEAAVARPPFQSLERHNHPALLKREGLNRAEHVYDFIGTARAHLGMRAFLDDVEKWAKENAHLFPNVLSAKLQAWRNPQPHLCDLAMLRLVQMYGLARARDWTKEKRPRKGLAGLRKDYARYVGERKYKGCQPLYERKREFKAAVKRAKEAIKTLQWP